LNTAAVSDGFTGRRQAKRVLYKLLLKSSPRALFEGSVLARWK
jgi:hypothetical protein